MGIKYEVLIKKPQVFKRIAGVSVSEFESIAKKCLVAWKKKEKAKKLSGRPPKLKGLKNHLLSLLIYYRTYITYEFLGYLFSVDETTVMRAIKKLEPILVKAVAIKKDRTLSADDLTVVLIDATEQPINRPKKGQKKYYSGKKKTIQ